MIIYVMILWGVVMRTRWWLHSTTGSYGRLVLEVAYGETIIHCLGDFSLGRVVGVSTWYITHGRHTRVNTSVGTIYGIFRFYKYKSLYVLCFENLYVLWKKHWWFLTLSWPDDIQMTFSTTHNIFLYYANMLLLKRIWTYL